MRSILFVLIVLVARFMYAGECTLEPFNRDRDYESIRTIINYYPDYLDWDNIGCPKGTTDSFFFNRTHVTTVARYQGNTIGFINYCLCHDNDYRKIKGKIDLLGVDPGYQRMGYGSALLTSAITFFKSKHVSHIELGVKAENHVARCLYEKHGFIEQNTYSICGAAHLRYEIPIERESAATQQGVSSPATDNNE